MSNGIPRPIYVKPGEDPTRHDLRQDGDVNTRPGCWKILAIIALPIGLIFGAGGVAAMSAPTKPAPTIAASPTPAAQPSTPIPTFAPTATPAPMTTTPFITPQVQPTMQPTAVTTYCYRKLSTGETVSQVAAEWRVTIAYIQKWNTWLKNPSYIYKGAVLKIPCQRR